MLLGCSVILGFLHVCIQTFDILKSTLVESIVVIELNLSKHRGCVKGLRKIIAVLQRCLFPVNHAEWLRVLVITSVVYDVYLVFHNNLSFLTWFSAVRRVETLVKTCFSTAYFVISLNILYFLDFACERIYLCSWCLNHFLCRWLLCFKIYLWNWTIFCLNRVLFLPAVINLLLGSLMDSLTKLVVRHLKDVRFRVIRVIALALILLSTAIWMIRVMSCDSTVQC